MVIMLPGIVTECTITLYPEDTSFISQTRRPAKMTKIFHGFPHFVQVQR
jgi:hypothetical protein